MSCQTATVVETGGIADDAPGYDLTGLIVGNEGTFGIVTQAVVNLTRDPEAGRTLLAVFDSVDDATETVSGIIAAAIVPAALEMLDNLMIRAVEQAFGFGFPTEAGAVLIIEVDGLDAGLNREAQAISEIVQANGGSVGKVDSPGGRARSPNTSRSGRAANRHLAQSDGSRPPIARRMASSREPSCPIY